MRERRIRPEKYEGLKGNRNACKAPEHRKPKQVHIGIAVPQELADRIETARGDVSKSRFMRRALEAYLHSSKTSDEQNNVTSST